MSGLWEVRVGFRSQPQQINFVFTDGARAARAAEELSARGAFPEDGRVVITDDAGSRVALDRSDLMYVWRVEIEAQRAIDREIQVQAAVHQVRGQVAVNTDERVKAAVQTAQLAGMPVGMNGPAAGQRRR